VQQPDCLADGKRAETTGNVVAGTGGAMQVSLDERIRQLTEPMLRKKLYVLFSTPTGTPEQIKACLPAHLEYMIRLEKEGVVFASGPLTSSGAPPAGEGMTVLRVASAEEARRIAEQDPFYVAGLRTVEVREWTLMEGTIGLKVNFSDRSIAFD
jgi:uncharacterized protein YciI